MSTPSDFPGRGTLVAEWPPGPNPYDRVYICSIELVLHSPYPPDESQGGGEKLRTKMSTRTDTTLTLINFFISFFSGLCFTDKWSISLYLFGVVTSCGCVRELNVGVGERDHDGFLWVVVVCRLAS